MTDREPGAQDPLLQVARAARGDRAALDGLMKEIYGAVHQIAAAQMAGEAKGHTLQTTAIVNEAYLRLIEQRNLKLEDRSQFLAAVAVTVRRVLVDYARRRGAEKRGGDVVRVEVEGGLEGLAAADDRGEGPDVLAVDRALARLSGLNERIGRVVELRFFGGLTVEQAAEALGISVRTVHGDWAFARAWLKKELSGETGPPTGSGGESQRG